MKLILLGAPGAGKGTQADIIKKKLDIPTISTGNILRAAVKNGTPTGLKAKEYMDAGKLVPDEVIIGIINERLQEADCANGYILDGVPRTIAQAEALEQAGIRFDAVVAIEIPDEKIIARMGGRWPLSLPGGSWKECSGGSFDPFCVEGGECRAAETEYADRSGGAHGLRQNSAGHPNRESGGWRDRFRR